MWVDMNGIKFGKKGVQFKKETGKKDLGFVFYLFFVMISLPVISYSFNNIISAIRLMFNPMMTFVDILLLIIYLSFNLIMCYYFGYASYSLMIKKPNAVPIVNLSLILLIILSFVELIIGRLRGELSLLDILVFSLVLAQCGVWLSYFKFSKKAKKIYPEKDRVLYLKDKVLFAILLIMGSLIELFI